MDSGMISKIEKAMLYARERDRVSFNSFSVTFQGDHKTHTVTYDKGRWDCDCAYFQTNGICSHVMAMERILNASVKAAETSHSRAYMDSSAISKIEKGMIYAAETDRITFSTFEAVFDGDHCQHILSYKDGVWSCDCSYFQSHGICSHVMAMERILDGCVTPAEVEQSPVSV